MKVIITVTWGSCRKCILQENYTASYSFASCSFHYWTCYQKCSFVQKSFFILWWHFIIISCLMTDCFPQWLLHSQHISTAFHSDSFLIISRQVCLSVFFFVVVFFVCKGVLLTPVFPHLSTKHMSLAMYPWLTVLHLADKNIFIPGKAL